MKKNIIRFVTILVLAALGIFLYELSYAPFTPLKFDNQYGLVALKVGPGFYKNLALVLTDNEVPFKKDGTQIYLRRYLLQDEEVIWNYTSRALDENWLKDIPHTRIIKKAN